MFHLWFFFNPYFYSSPHLPPLQNYYGFFLFPNIISSIEEEENRRTSSVSFLEQVDKDKDSIKVVGRMQKKEKMLLGFLWNLIWDNMRGTEYTVKRREQNQT